MDLQTAEDFGRIPQPLPSRWRVLDLRLGDLMGLGDIFGVNMGKAEEPDNYLILFARST